MSWLDEIEYIYQLIEKPPRRGGRKAMAKMARVLREYIAEIKYRRALNDYQNEGMTGFRHVYCTTIVPDEPKLSDDAKELLHDHKDFQT